MIRNSKRAGSDFLALLFCPHPMLFFRQREFPLTRLTAFATLSHKGRGLPCRTFSRGHPASPPQIPPPAAAEPPPVPNRERSPALDLPVGPPTGRVEVPSSASPGPLHYRFLL